jgi:allophanate hydrolase subunit 2
MSRVNRGIGNDIADAVIETAGGLVLRALSPTMVLASSWSSPVRVATGDTIAIAPDPARRWTQVAVSGGIYGLPVLGSLSADTMASIAPVPIRVGSVLCRGARHSSTPTDLTADTRDPNGAVRLWLGPRADYVEGDPIEVLTSSVARLGEGSRVGVRLDGVELRRSNRNELPSEGMIPGAIQVPHDGRPIVMGPDHPVTGGYPVVAIVDPRDLWMLWCRPMSSPVRFIRAERGDGLSV